MTDSTQPADDPNELAEGQPAPTADEQSETDPADATDGDERDPLSTDDGLAAAAEQMPAVDDDREDDGPGNAGDGEPVDLPDLQVGADETDPVADEAKPGEQDD